jgi:hypothetical protein
MKTIIKNTLVLALILPLFFSCSKFEDGPKISFRSIEKRIYGTYRIEYFSKNGTDLTDYWNQYYDISFKFYRDYDGSWPDIYGKSVKGYIDSLGYMKFFTSYGYHFNFNIGNEVTLQMTNTVFDSTWYPNRELFPIITYWGNGPVEPYAITKLTKDEMWLELEDGNDFYEIHMKE